ncbi:MAG TPA: HlyD family secretion protein [Opitutaceae bacterium]|jgi:membrane fusion protein (multidrug efflux system)|nr:HlyD family secretion protein [Opitutaceae bacterium]
MDSSTTTSSAPTTTISLPPAAPRRPGRTILITVVTLGIAAWLVDFGWHAWHYEETDDAYVSGHLHQISPQIDGQVKEVLVNDNQPVKAGDVLVRLEPLETNIAVEKAVAGVAQAHAQEAQTSAAVAETQARVEQAKAQIAQVNAQMQLARINFERDQRMFGDGKSGAITQSALDQSRSTFAAVQASAEAAQANLTAAQAAQQSAFAQTTAANAALAAAEADLRDARRQSADTVITAPADGLIGNKSVEPGNHVKAGQTLLALAEPDTWIIANFKETQLARMHPGLPVDITIDALSGQVLHGKIDSLSPASGAQFALLPADNATGNFNKVVQRVPVKIILDDDSRAQAGDRLRLGFSVVASVRVR